MTDEDVAQILSQDHTVFGVSAGDPFHDKESERFVARSIERTPLTLERLSIHDDVVTYIAKDGAAPASLAVALAKAERSMPWSFLLNSRVTYQKPTRASQDTMDGIPVGAEVNALSSPLLPLKNRRATIGVSSVSYWRSIHLAHLFCDPVLHGMIKARSCQVASGISSFEGGNLILPG